VKITDVSDEQVVARELVLIKVATSKDTRSAIIGSWTCSAPRSSMSAATRARCRSHRHRGQGDALIGMLTPYGIKELVRTGRVAMVRRLSTVAAPAVDGAGRHYKSAGEGKPKVGSLI
jgi:acetolactate synthase-1/3 small subunit